MLRNYFKIAIRTLLRDKTYSLITILGLAAALTVSFITLLFILDEFNYDRFNKKADNIYRVVYGNEKYITATPFPLAPILKADFPEILNTVRVIKTSLQIKNSSGWIKEKNILFADKSFFEIFTLPLIRGNYKSALNEPFSVVITRLAAEKYFGKNNPVGKTLNILIDKTNYDLQITALIDHFPKNSHFTGDFIVSMSVAEKVFKSMEKLMQAQFGFCISLLDSWDASSFSTYILLPDKYDIKKLDEKLPAFYKKHKETAGKFNLHFQPLLDIHLSSDTRAENGQNNSMRNIFLFSSVALLVLAVACFNFIILSTARSTNRLKEIGLRKVIGADKTDIFKQILGESICVSFTALPVSLLFVEIILPFINQLLDRTLVINYLNNWQYILGLLIITSLVGVLSGIYIAFHASALHPTEILKGIPHSGRNKYSFRKSLIIAQLSVLIFMLVCTIIYYKQLNFLHKKDIGFNINHLITFSITNENFKKTFQTFKHETEASPDIISVSAAYDVPPSESGIPIKISTLDKPEIQHDMKWVFVEYDFFKTLQAKLFKGRDFSGKFNDIQESVILNETAFKKLGVRNIETCKINIGDNTEPRKIIGIAKDFHESSLHNLIPAMIFSIMPSQIRQVVIRIHTENYKEALSFIKASWEKFNPDEAFEFTYIKDEYERFYSDEDKLGFIISIFTIITILISCLGLVGISTFIADRQIKEIGIRKTLGASVFNIVKLSLSNFIKWVSIAFIIAAPISYLIVDKWLQDFAYRVEISIWTFLISGGVALVITLATISYQVINAATANPVESLKYE